MLYYNGMGWVGVETCHAKPGARYASCNIFDAELKMGATLNRDWGGVVRTMLFMQDSQPRHCESSTSHGINLQIWKQDLKQCFQKCRLELRRECLYEMNSCTSHDF